jgi:hypothetical protein
VSVCWHRVLIYIFVPSCVRVFHFPISPYFSPSHLYGLFFRPVLLPSY